jgi:hypothetical protein
MKYGSTLLGLPASTSCRTYLRLRNNKNQQKKWPPNSQNDPKINNKNQQQN